MDPRRRFYRSKPGSQADSPGRLRGPTRGFRLFQSLSPSLQAPGIPMFGHAGNHHRSQPGGSFAGRPQCQAALPFNPRGNRRPLPGSVCRYKEVRIHGGRGQKIWAEAFRSPAQLRKFAGVLCKAENAATQPAFLDRQGSPPHNTGPPSPIPQGGPA